MGCRCWRPEGFVCTYSLDLGFEGDFPPGDALAAEKVQQESESLM